VRSEGADRKVRALFRPWHRPSGGHLRPRHTGV